MPVWSSSPVYHPPPLDAGPAQPIPGLPDYGRYTTLAPAPVPQITTLCGGPSQTPGPLDIWFVLVKTVGGTDYLYVQANWVIYTFALDGTLLSSTPSPLVAPNVFAVDDDGAFYVGAGATLKKAAPDGSVLWSISPGVGSIRAAVPQGSGASWQLLVSGTSTTVASVRVAKSGAIGAPSPVLGEYCCDDPTSGGIVTGFGGYLCFWTASGALAQKWGGAGLPLGQAMIGPDGLVYLGTTTAGLRVYTRDGFAQGGQQSPGPLGTFREWPWGTPYKGLLLWGSDVYWVSGPPLARSGGWAVLRAPFSDFAAAAHAPSLPYAPWPGAPTLGPGAALGTPADSNYFAPGQTPSAQLTLDPWWTMHSADTALHVTVRERSQVLARAPVPVQTLAIPQSAQRPITLPIDLPPARPGFYVVEVTASQDGVARCGDALYYGVGAAGATLDMASLAAGAGFGGPTAQRAVGLAAALGFGVVRVQLDTGAMLSSAASTAPLNFAPYDSQIRAAAALAQQRGVILEVQVGQGTTVDRGLVQNGTWGQRIGEMVQQWRDVVHYWEAWNEPAGTWGSAQTYVTQILAPFYDAVKAVDPGAQVVGGTVLGGSPSNLAYWQTIGQSGGFAKMDVIATHPYSGYNRSWEEDGWPVVYAQLAAIFAQYGAAGKPVWITEIAFWSSNPYNLFAQADALVRLMLHARALGIAQVCYFILEGGYDWYTSNSLIQNVGNSAAAPWIKPSALAMMTYRATVGRLPFRTSVATGAPYTYGQLYGPDADGASVLVLWTDGVRQSVLVSSTVPVPVTEELGARFVLTPQAGQVQLALDGAPRYLRVPGGPAPTVQPAIALLPNVAGDAGAQLSASSAHASTPLARLTDGTSGAGQLGAFPACNVFATALGDSAPSVTLLFARPMSVGQTLLSGHSLGSIMPGLRDLDLYGQSLDGTWALLASARNVFHHHRVLLSFAPRPLLGLRAVGRAVNFGGDGGGPRPWYFPYQQTDPNNPSYGPLCLYEWEAFGQPSLLGAPPWSGPALPSGYAHGQRVVLGGGSADVAGSRTVPPVLAATAQQQDYVATIHLSGLDACAIWDTLADQAQGADLGLFWWTGSAWSQIDYHPDVTTYGAWGPYNITLRFRLQAPLAAGAGASDPNYLVAWGNPSPTSMRNAQNVYGFFDDFGGSSVGSAWTPSGSATMAVQGGVLTISAPALAGWAMLLSQHAYGTGWAVLARAQMPYPSAGGIKPELGFRAAIGFGPALASLSDSVYGAPYGFGLREGSTSLPNMTSPIAPGDGAWHTLCCWRESTGAVLGSVDEARGTFAPAGNLQTGALPLSFGVFNGGTDSYTMAADWIAVRPIIASEPTVSLQSQ